MDKYPKLKIAARTIGIFGLLSFLFLFSAYSFQNYFLYIPDRPKRYMRDNPTSYRSPTMRDMLYQDVEIETEDGLHIRGYSFIFII